MATRTSPFVIEKIIALSLKGMSIFDVADQLNVSSNTVQRYRKIKGIKDQRVRTPSQQRRLDLNRLASARRLEFRELGVSALIGPPIPEHSICYRAPRAPYRCRHGIEDGYCPRCEKEERRFVGIKEEVSAHADDLE